MAPDIFKERSPYSVSLNCDCGTGCTYRRSAIITERVEISELVDVIKEVKLRIKHANLNKHSTVTLNRELVQLEAAMKLVRKYGITVSK